MIEKLAAKPFSAACERNSLPILQVLQQVLPTSGALLEIGSGTGQHAVSFAAALPDICWQTSDRRENHAGIIAWLADSAEPKPLPPIPLDVLLDEWPKQQFEMIYSANTLHIMSWPAVEATFNGISTVLASNGVAVIYGPFNYGGKCTSESNAEFDAMLRGGDPAMGIRDFEAVNALAEQAGLRLEQDIAMPANNRCLVWRKAT